MKTKAEISIEVKMTREDALGTVRVGYLPLRTKYADIVKCFGKPSARDIFRGVEMVEWVGRINGLVFTIYNYKSELPVSKTTEWHIGANAKFTGDLVNLYFQKRISK